MKVQRLRVTFGRGEELKYITHLDLMRFFERALRRANLPVAYSEGFSPHAQLSLAAPLPVGTTSDAELMDVFLEERLAPKTLLAQLAKQTPAGITLRGAEEVAVGLPALQAEVRFADYEVDVALPVRTTSAMQAQIAPLSGKSAPADGDGAAVARVAAPIESVEQVQSAVRAFLAAASVPWQHKRDDEIRSYDIRAQVERIEVVPAADGVRLTMRLKNDNTGSGRPEQVAAALGLSTPLRIHRTKLILAGTSPAREAWRKHGRFAS